MEKVFVLLSLVLLIPFTVAPFYLKCGLSPTDSIKHSLVCGPTGSGITSSISCSGSGIRQKCGNLNRQLTDRISKQFAEDVQAYSQWVNLEHFVYVVYGADDLKEPVLLDQLAGLKEANGKRFRAHIVRV